MAVKAISSWLSDFCIFIIRLLVFILFGNPLSMFIFNFLTPRKAAEFANNRTIFGEKIYAFYEGYALRWPFLWARYWMKLENIAQYPVERQILYFLKVATKNKTEVETLKAMQKDKSGETFFWPKAYETLFFSYGNKKLPYEETRSHTVGECTVVHWTKVTVAEFMMRNVRLSWQALQKVIRQTGISEDMCDELKKYLSRGKINDSQLELLIDAVATDPGSGDFPMLGVFIDYVKRYGISKKHLERVHKQYPFPFSGLVDEASTLYKQMLAIKAFKHTAEGKSVWREFCVKTPKILPEVQKLMSMDQYQIFHDTGHELDIEVVKAFLHGSDKARWNAVFTLETKACKSKDIQALIHGNADLELAYRDALKI